MKYTQVQADTFKQIQLNAGILMESFTPSTQTAGTLIGATSGGINFTATPTYTDFGEDIDNAPKNLKEFKKLDTWEAKMSGTFASVTEGLVKKLVGAGVLDSTNHKITPQNEVATTDFADIWWVGDYSNVNEDGSGSSSTQKAGYIAIHLMNALSTGGFQIQSSDKAKGQFSFEFTGHYSLGTTASPTQDVVPFEVYIVQGTEETAVSTDE